MRHKLTGGGSKQEQLNRLGKDVCVSCKKAPREGTYKRKGKDTPHTTCAACRVKGAAARQRTADRDAAEVAAAAGARASAALDPFHQGLGPALTWTWTWTDLDLDLDLH
jgi:hypothetical protein